MTTKLLREKYKTYEGARKRAGFENGIARSEFNAGYKAHVYHYVVVAEGDSWRVERRKAGPMMWDLATTLRCATRTLALQVATDRIKHQLRAKGLHVSSFTRAQLQAQGEAYLQDHRDELIPEARALAEQFAAEGIFGKRVAKAYREGQEGAGVRS